MPGSSLTVKASSKSGIAVRCGARGDDAGAGLMPPFLQACDLHGWNWEDSLTVFCGIDWAERHHDVAPVDEVGTPLAKARITDDAAGYHQLLHLLAEHGDSPDDPIPVAIETSHGLLVASLRTGRRQVFAINPLAAARYRDRHGVS